jgi:hypothetical protein
MNRPLDVPEGPAGDRMRELLTTPKDQPIGVNDPYKTNKRQRSLEMPSRPQKVRLDEVSAQISDFHRQLSGDLLPKVFSTLKEMVTFSQMSTNTKDKDVTNQLIADIKTILKAEPYDILELQAGKRRKTRRRKNHK